jgi:hypothetical protein
MLHISLNILIAKLTADKTFGVKHCIVGVHRHLILGSITDQTLRVGEGDERGSGTVTLVIGNDFNPILPEDTHT